MVISGWSHNRAAETEHSGAHQSGEGVARMPGAPDLLQFGKRCLRGPLPCPGSPAVRPGQARWNRQH